MKDLQQIYFEEAKPIVTYWCNCIVACQNTGHIMFSSNRNTNEHKECTLAINNTPCQIKLRLKLVLRKLVKLVKLVASYYLAIE